MQTRKHTAWKKNRKLGDIWGGRTFPKLTDKIFKQHHSLIRPDNDQETPLFIIDNPSSYFYFPITTDEVKQTLAALPTEHIAHLTHIWFQKIKKADYLDNLTIQGCFICGGGVNLIILHSFPIDNKMRLGLTKPIKKTLNYYKNYTTALAQDSNGWYLQWTEEAIKKYYLESLLLHEVGHAVDSLFKRYWSKATDEKREKFAENYISIWGDSIRQISDHSLII